MKQKIIYLFSLLLLSSVRANGYEVKFSYPSSDITGTIPINVMQEIQLVGSDKTLDFSTTRPRIPYAPILIYLYQYMLLFGEIDFTHITISEFYEEQNEEGQIIIDEPLSSDTFDMSQIPSGCYKIKLLLDNVEWSGIIYL